MPRRKHGHVSCKASGCVIHGGKLSTKLHPPGLTLGRAMPGAQGGTQGQQSACDRGCPGHGATGSHRLGGAALPHSCQSIQVKKKQK